MEELLVGCQGWLHGSALPVQGLFEKFQKEYWPNCEKEGGKKEFRTYLRLVLMTSVLEPKALLPLSDWVKFPSNASRQVVGGRPQTLVRGSELQDRIFGDSDRLICF